MKRKDFSKLTIEVQNEKNSYFNHENYIAGAPPFLRGIHSFPQNNYNLANNSTTVDIKDANFEKKVHEVLNNNTETVLILITNNTNTTAEIQIAELLLKTHQLVSNYLKKGIKIDDIASKIAFSWSITTHLPFEIAKIRATRLLWAKMIHRFQPKNKKSLALQIYIEKNNYLASFIGTTGGTQNTWQHNNLTTFSNKTIDPWAGSTVIEKLTENFTLKTWQLFLVLIS